MPKLTSTTVQMGLGGNYRELVIGLTAIGFWRLDEIYGQELFPQNPLYRLYNQGSGGSASDMFVAPSGALATPWTYGVRTMLPEGALAMTPDGVGQVGGSGNTLFAPGTGSFWFGAIVTPNTFSASAFPLYFYGTDNSTFRWSFATGPNRLVASVMDNTLTTASVSFNMTAGTTYVVFCVVDRTANLLRIYVNGTQQSTASTAAVGSIGGAGVGTLALAATDATMSDIQYGVGLPSAASVLAQYNATQWTDVTADVELSMVGYTLDYGIQGGEPFDRVAGPGEFRFLLNNSTTNSGGKLGYYSPAHANCRSGFGIGTPVRLKYVNGAITRYKFFGKISDIQPMPGKYEVRQTAVVASDFMGDMVESPIRNMSVLTQKPTDFVLGAVVTNMRTRPPAIAFSKGLCTVPFAFDTSDDQQSTPNSEAQRLALSEVGYIFQRGDGVTGGTLVFTNRTDRLSLSPDIALSDASTTADMQELGIQISRGDVLNTVTVMVNPRNLSSGVVVVYSTTSPIAIGAGETLSLFAPYRDPAQPLARIGATAVIAPVSGTDWIANSLADGSGAVMTANVTVTGETPFGGNGAYLTITNSASSTAFLTTLQLRGTALYHYDSPFVTVSDATSQRQYGKNILRYDMAYESSISIANTVATWLKTVWGNPFSRARSVAFWANRSSTLLDAMLTVDIGRTITITETVTGVSTARTFAVQHVHIWSPDNINQYVTWQLAPLDNTVYWILETSQIDISAKLAPL